MTSSVPPAESDPTDLSSLHSRFVADQLEAAYLSGDSLNQFATWHDERPVPISRAELLPSLMNPVIMAAVRRFSDPQPPVTCDHVDFEGRRRFWWPDIAPYLARCGACFPIVCRAAAVRGLVEPRCNRCAGDLEEFQIVMDNRSRTGPILMALFCRPCIEHARAAA